MPRLLKSETIQRISGSQKALRLALFGLAMPIPIETESMTSDYAAEIGLLGSSAELAISACLYEVLGRSGVIKSDGSYPTAAQALAEFRKLLKSGISKLSSLTKGVPDPTTHLENIQNATKTFRALFTARAGGLHAGSGVSRDVAYLVAAEIAEFLKSLSLSTKWKPYLREIPIVPPLPKSRQLIAEELAQLINHSSLEEAELALKSIFIVLPDLSEDEPDWIGSLERVNIAPNKTDIKILLNSLQTAHVGDISKVGKGVQSIPARIDKNSPGSFPVNFVTTKKAFTKTHERWSAEIGNANGYLQDDQLYLPSIQSIYDYFALTPEEIGISPEVIERGISAQEAWPFIAASFDYQGTTGPCFFFARMIMDGEMPQLIAHLQRAANHSSKIQENLNDYIPLLETLQPVATVLRSNHLADTLINAFKDRSLKREQLLDNINSRLIRVPEDYQTSKDKILDSVTNSDSLSALFEEFSTDVIELGDAYVNPILRLLIDATTERDEVAGLVELIGSKKYPQIKTNIRKALRDIDFAVYGPMIEGGYD